MLTYDPHYIGIVPPENVNMVSNLNSILADANKFMGAGKTVVFVESITKYFDNCEPFEGDFENEGEYSRAFYEYQDTRDRYLSGAVPSSIHVNFYYLVFNSLDHFYSELDDDPFMFIPNANSMLEVDEVSDGEYVGEDVDGLNERAWSVFVKVL